MTRQSPGFNRMKERMGAEAFEALRLDTIRKQEEALRNVATKSLNDPLVERKHEITRDIIKGKRK